MISSLRRVSPVLPVCLDKTAYTVPLSATRQWRTIIRIIENHAIKAK
jgi:hypothetical protein